MYDVCVDRQDIYVDLMSVNLASEIKDFTKHDFVAFSTSSTVA